MGVFSRALRAVNAALNSWYSTAYNDAAGDSHVIGNVYITPKGEVVTKPLNNETKAVPALLTLTSTSETGKIKSTTEYTIQPSGNQLKSKELQDSLEANATGTLSWSMLGDTSSYYASIKDWGGQPTQLFKISDKPVTTYGLKISINKDRNEFYVEATNGNYQNIHIYVIGFDGSDYDFSLFDLEHGEKQAISYPDSMDRILPFNRVSIWFELSTEQKQLLLSM